MRGAELRDVTCFAWLHWKLVCLWQFYSSFRFAVAARVYGKAGIRNPEPEPETETEQEPEPEPEPEPKK